MSWNPFKKKEAPKPKFSTFQVDRAADKQTTEPVWTYQHRPYSESQAEGLLKKLQRYGCKTLEEEDRVYLDGEPDAFKRAVYEANGVVLKHGPWGKWYYVKSKSNETK